MAEFALAPRISPAVISPSVGRRVHSLWPSACPDSGLPYCFAGQPFDLSLRRDFIIPGADLEPCTVINSGGKAKLLFVHNSDSPVAFVSNWDLVQLAVYTPAEFCIHAIVEPPGGPGPESTGGTPEALLAGADVNFDGQIDIGDLASFSNAYSDAAPLADYNGDELVTSDDALTFLTDFVEQIED